MAFQPLVISVMLEQAGGMNIMGLTPLVAGFGLLALAMAGCALLVRAGIRAGDRPSDAVVTVEPATRAMLDGDIPVVVATVHNKASAPVVVGISLRRRLLPDWLAGANGVRTPRWTSRERFRPERHTVLGVVDAGERGRWSLPLADNERRINLVAVIGQSRNRLRMIDRPVTWATNPVTQSADPATQTVNTPT